MYFHLEIRSDNAAFEADNCDAEVARILRDLAERVETDGPLIVYDSNGNKVGKATYGRTPKES